MEQAGKSRIYLASGWFVSKALTGGTRREETRGLFCVLVVLYIYIYYWFSQDIVIYWE